MKVSQNSILIMKKAMRDYLRASELESQILKESKQNSSDNFWWRHVGYELWNRCWKLSIPNGERESFGKYFYLENTNDKTITTAAARALAEVVEEIETGNVL